VTLALRSVKIDIRTPTVAPQSATVAGARAHANYGEMMVRT
jgi:hypothetical protein